MARLPVVQSETQAITGSSGAEMLRSNPADFGAIGAEEIGQLGQGLEQNVHAGGRILRASMYAEKRAKELQDNTWVHNTLLDQNNGILPTLSSWQADPKNNMSQTYADDYQKLGTRTIQDAVKGAPSPEAAQQLTNQAGEYLFHSHSEALHTQYNNVLTNSLTSFDGQISGLVNSWRDHNKTPGGMSDGLMLAGVQTLRNEAVKNYSGVAPKALSGIQQTITEQAANATMNDNPDLAKQIVAQHKDLDEVTRSSLNRKIDESQRVQLSLVGDSFKRSISDNLTNLANGKPGTKPIDEKQFTTMLPKEEAASTYQRYTDEVDTINKVGKWKDDVDGLAPQYQKQALQDLHGKIDGAHDQQTFDAILKHYYDNGQLMDKDRVSWMQQTNPKVRSLQQAASESSEVGRAAAVNEYHSAILKFQGPAPKDATPEEAKRYLDLPFNDRHILPMDDAKNYADALAKSSPQQVVPTLKKVMQNYPDVNHQQMVANDIHNASSDPMKAQDYSLLWQNRDHPAAAQMAGAAAGGDEAKKLVDPKVVEQMNKEILTDPTWLKFQYSMLGGNFDRLQEISGYQQNVQRTAQAYVASGMKPDAAVNKAVGDVFSTLGFADVNGSTMCLDRGRTDSTKPKRSDAEVEDIGRKLTLALGHIDPREIDQTPFNKSLAPYGNDQAHIPRLQAFRDQITQRGMFVTTTDGQGAILNYKDDNGFPVELRDKNNNPFIIHFDDLPAMTHHADSVGPFSMPDLKDSPQKSYPLTHSWRTQAPPGSIAGIISGLTMGRSEPRYTSSNFPITADYWKHDQGSNPSMMPNTISNPKADEALRAQVFDMKIK